jgi:hypothetical protein
MRKVTLPQFEVGKGYMLKFQDRAVPAVYKGLFWPSGNVSSAPTSTMRDMSISERAVFATATERIEAEKCYDSKYKLCLRVVQGKQLRPSRCSIADQLTVYA